MVSTLDQDLNQFWGELENKWEIERDERARDLYELQQHVETAKGVGVGGKHRRGRRWGKGKQGVRGGRI